MQVYLNTTIPIPVRSMVGPTPIIIADKGRTASGKLRSDIAWAGRQWKVTTTKLTYAQWTAIYDYLETLVFGETLWWHDDLGGTAATNSVYVEVELSDSQLVEFGDSTGWQASGRELSLTVIESR